MNAGVSGAAETGHVTLKEWRWAAGGALILLFLSCVPYWVAAWAAPEGWIFSGLLVIPPDGYTYLAK